MYRVLWIDSALDDMANLWIDADSEMRDDLKQLIEEMK